MHNLHDYTLITWNVHELIDEINYFKYLYNYIDYYIMIINMEWHSCSR